MNLFDRFRGRGESRSQSLTLNELMGQFQYQGLNYGGGAFGGSLNQTPQELPTSWQAYLDVLYKSSSVVFACIEARRSVFSEMRFTYRNSRGDTYGSPDLKVLEQPWTNGTTRNLLSRALLDVDLAGNSFWVRDGDTLRNLPQQYTTIVLGSKSDPGRPGLAYDAEILGYIYDAPGYEPQAFLAKYDHVTHWAPIPDPYYRFRGQSWLSVVTREVMADNAAITHKLKFFEQGATPATVVKLDASIRREAFDAWVKAFKEGHEGAANAYKTIYLGGGADVQVVGSNLQQLSFAEIQGHGETRIAAAARVPPIIVGFSEGLNAATYSNYGQARRAYGDGTLRPLWGDCVGAFAPLVNVQSGSELWYDDSRCSFLREDQADLAEIININATAMTSLITGGYEPDTVTQAVTSGDLTRLKHTGKTSVQLHDPNAPPPPKTAPQLPAPVEKKSADDELALLRAKLAPWLPPELDPPAREMNVINGPFTVEVNLPETHVDARTTVEAAKPADVNVTVEPARADVHVPVTVEAAQAPDVHVPVTVEAARAPDVHIDAPVTVEPPPPAEIHVDARSDIHVPEQKQRHRKIDVKRDEAGRAETYEIVDE